MKAGGRKRETDRESESGSEGETEREKERERERKVARVADRPELVEGRTHFTVRQNKLCCTVDRSHFIYEAVQVLL